MSKLQQKAQVSDQGKLPPRGNKQAEPQGTSYMSGKGRSYSFDRNYFVRNYYWKQK